MLLVWLPLFLREGAKICVLCKGSSKLMTGWLILASYSGVLLRSPVIMMLCFTGVEQREMSSSSWLRHYSFLPRFTGSFIGDRYKHTIRVGLFSGYEFVTTEV